MKYTLLFLLLFCALFNLRAQSPVPSGQLPAGGHISGTVLDSLARTPLDYATVSIFPKDSKTPITGVHRIFYNLQLASNRIQIHQDIHPDGVEQDLFYQTVKLVSFVR